VSTNHPIGNVKAMEMSGLVSCWELEGIRTAKLSAALAERGGHNNSHQLNPPLP
jgi:hypothetical protein